ncbi:MAG TPA: undecaprenyl diphosphate synthase family protein, partial [Acidimicrobiales bacterium]|nr:undecaprenyl diphosphate synthase family protein [Acidimicrobiales bacterium]
MTADGSTTRATVAADLDLGRIPTHIACVMDGNGRWAQRRGLPRTEGHAAGEQALFDTVEGALDIGLRWLTAWAFSSAPATPRPAHTRPISPTTEAVRRLASAVS